MMSDRSWDILIVKNNLIVDCFSTNKNQIAQQLAKKLRLPKYWCKWFDIMKHQPTTMKNLWYF
jgi:hypothetical protein